MKLNPGEPLKLRVFIDRCMIEVFANDGRLALSRVAYPPAGATGTTLYANGGPATATHVRMWDIMPTNPY
jgi:sucrose-6-phosphate hydrolase SacC (GH32 family)